MIKNTLCWDCKNAINGCSWSKELKPVEGWDAEVVEPTASKPYSTYHVNACPQFIGTSTQGGQKRE